MGKKRGAKKAQKKVVHPRSIAPASNAPIRVDKRNVKIMRGYRV